LNQMKQQIMAMHTFADGHPKAGDNHFPAAQNDHATITDSYVFALLPFMEDVNLYNSIAGGTPGGDEELSWGLCPSFAGPTNSGYCYKANTGTTNHTANGAGNGGMRYTALSDGTGLRTGEFRDGLSKTIMIFEGAGWSSNQNHPTGATGSGIACPADWNLVAAFAADAVNADGISMVVKGTDLASGATTWDKYLASDHPGDLVMVGYADGSQAPKVAGQLTIGEFTRSGGD